MKIIKKILLAYLLTGFCSTQLTYAQKGDKDITKKMQGIWIAQGIILKDATKIPAQDKEKMDEKLKAISQNVHNRLAFAFDATGSFKAINTADNKRIAGTWKVKGKNLFLISQDVSFNKEFGKANIEFIGEMLDMYVDFSTESHIKKYKPCIRFQQGSIDELNSSPKQQVGERELEPKPETLQPVENLSDYVTYKTLTWAVAPTKVNCQRHDKEPCLQVRDDANKEWSALTQKIEGFEHTEGFEYILYVSERTFKKPPLTGSEQTVFYTLLQIVSKTKK